MYTETRETFVAGRLNVGVNLRERPTTWGCAFVVMGNGVPVDTVKLNSTHTRPKKLLEGVPSHRERF